jgi:hypothetical protein
MLEKSNRSDADEGDSRWSMCSRGGGTHYSHTLFWSPSLTISLAFGASQWGSVLSFSTRFTVILDYFQRLESWMCRAATASSDVLSEDPHLWTHHSLCVPYGHSIHVPSQFWRSWWGRLVCVNWPSLFVLLVVRCPSYVGCLLVAVNISKSSPWIPTCR